MQAALERRLGRKGKPKIKAQESQKKGDKAEPQKTQQDLNTALTIKFGKHNAILREVEKLADKEVRPVDLQVIYILKKYLNNGEMVK